MRSAAYVVGVGALAVALGVGAAAVGGGVASAWWGDVQFSVTEPPVDSVDLAPHFGAINPGKLSVSKSLPEGLMGAVLQAGTDSLFDPQVVAGGVDPRQNRAALQGSAAATKKAASSKGGPSRAAR